VEARTFVFNALLVGDPNLFGDPDERPVGVLTLQLTEAVGDPDEFEAIGIVHLTRTLAEPYTMVLITNALTGAVVLGFHDPNELPGWPHGLLRRDDHSGRDRRGDDRRPPNLPRHGLHGPGAGGDGAASVHGPHATEVAATYSRPFRTFSAHARTSSSDLA
jgi:hypothetical protein